MAQEQEKKQGKGCFSPGCLVIAIAALALVVYGYGFSDELPVISLAAELIPIHLPIPGFEDGIPNTLPTAMLTSLFLIIIALLYKRAVNKAEKTGNPSRFLITIDMLYEGVFSFVASTVGKEKATEFFPLIGSFFFFILFSNWSGLLPGMGSIGVREIHHGHEVLIPIFRSPTADLSTTVGLALITQVVAQYYGFKYHGWKYLKKYFNFTADPDSGFLKPLLAGANGFASLLELMGEFIKVISFAFRLFGNVFAGEVLLMVISFLTAFLVVDAFIALELFVGAIQALIFSILSLIFYQMASLHH